MNTNPRKKRPHHQPDTLFIGELQEFTVIALSPDDPSLEPRERRGRPGDKRPNSKRPKKPKD